MHDEKRNLRMTGVQARELIRQNRMMRDILASWPAREVMMGFEKDWDLKRRSFLEQHPALNFDSGGENGDDAL